MKKIMHRACVISYILRLPTAMGMTDQAEASATYPTAMGMTDQGLQPQPPTAMGMTNQAAASATYVPLWA